MPVSQQVRLRQAVAELRAALPLPALNAAERSQFAKRVLMEKWTRRSFSWASSRVSRPTWKGTKLDTLHEIAHYLLPRELWAQARSKGEAWTRRETAWTLLALVQHKLGREAAKVLRAAYVKNGVKYRPRRKLDAVQKEKLRSRFLKPKPVPVAPRRAGARRISFADE